MRNIFVSGRRWLSFSGRRRRLKSLDERLMSGIHVIEHRAMATTFQVRIANQEKGYAAQAAQAAFAVMNELESHLSRFRASSDISQIAQLLPGEQLRLSESTFACLDIAKKMERA